MNIISPYTDIETLIDNGQLYQDEHTRLWYFALHNKTTALAEYIGIDDLQSKLQYIEDFLVTD